MRIMLVPTLRKRFFPPLVLNPEILCIFSFVVRPRNVNDHFSFYHVIPTYHYTTSHPEAAKIVNLHFPLIYIFARIYIPNLRKLKGKCKFYIFPKNVFFRRKIEDLCKNENFHFFLHTKNYYFVSISLVSSLDF